MIGTKVPMRSVMMLMSVYRAATTGIPKSAKFERKIPWTMTAWRLGSAQNLFTITMETRITVRTPKKQNKINTGSKVERRSDWMTLVKRRAGKKRLKTSLLCFKVFSFKGTYDILSGWQFPFHKTVCSFYTVGLGTCKVTEISLF